MTKFQTKAQQLSLNHLRQNIVNLRRSWNTIERDRTIFLSLLMMARLEQGISQAELAKRSGVEQATIARIERGRTNPSLTTLLKLTRALQCSLVVE